RCSRSARGRRAARVGNLRGSRRRRLDTAGPARRSWSTEGMDRRPVEPATAASAVRSSELLGFPPDARVLIVNCDDLGMYHAVNAAVVESIEQGIATSCSLMAPCPAAPHAIQLLREPPEVPFGVHLTLLRDGPHHRWGPLTATE